MFNRASRTTRLDDAPADGGSVLAAPAEGGRFARFSAAGVLHLAAQNGLIYGLFIIIVGNNASALATSAFVLTSTVPSILFGMVGGVAADFLPRKATLLVSLLLRGAVVAWLLEFDPGVSAVVGAVFAIWTIDQFYSPAECAALASVVDEQHVGRATAATNGLALVAQLLGAGLIAPLALRQGGPEALFAIVLVLLGGAFLLLASTPRLTPQSTHDGPTRVRPSIRRGWRTIRESRALFQSVMLFVLLDSALVIVVVAAPGFINDVLHVSTVNAVYIFAPAAVGVVFGLAVAPFCVRVLPSRVVAMIGFALFLGVVGALPFVHAIARELDGRSIVPFYLAEDWLHVSREIAVTALLLPLAGVGVTLVRVASKTAIYEQASDDVLAQVFATRATIDSVVTLVPTIAAGLLLLAVDARVMFIATSVVTGVMALVMLVGNRSERRTAEIVVVDFPLEAAAP